MDTEQTELWDYLVEMGIATEEELQLVTSINGMNLESLESVLYCRTSYRSLDQIKEMEEDE
jgi:hypothetical protein